MKQSGRLNGVDKAGTEVAVSSVRGCYMMCRMALDKAVEEGLLKRNPAVGCKLPQNNAALKIDKGIAKAEASELEIKEEPSRPEFTPVKTQRRRPGTGCVSQINENLWEGRYSPIWPDGKKHPRNIYAHSLEECEAMLKEMIQEVNAEIAEARKSV